jgi:Flp pilus assembly protein TadB
MAMLNEGISLLILVGAAVGVFYTLRKQRERRLSRERLAPVFTIEGQAEAPIPARPILARRRWLPWIIGLALALALHFLFGFRWVYGGAIGLMVSLLGGQVEAIFIERRIQKIETQLADAIDLMVGGLRAGAGVLNSLENSARETRVPLKPQFDEVVGRVRLGDDAQEVFQELAARVPLETFMLFSSALAVHWEVGGSLAPTLATVGRTIRDRIELTRRIRSMTAQSRMSIIGVLIATYAIAGIMWANDPNRMERFLISDAGSAFAAGAVALQAVGIVWSSAIARIKF